MTNALKPKLEELRKKAGARAIEEAPRDPAASGRFAMLMSFYAAVTPINSPNDMKRVAEYVLANNRDPAARRVAKIFLQLLLRKRVRMPEETCRATGFKNLGGEQVGHREKRKVRNRAMRQLAELLDPNDSLSLPAKCKQVLHEVSRSGRSHNHRGKKPPANQKQKLSFEILSAGQMPSERTVAKILKTNKKYMQSQ